MQIKMIGTFSYDLVPGVSRRTLHAGLVLDEPVDIAQAAISAGVAVRWPPESIDQNGSAEVDGQGEDVGSTQPEPPAPKPPGKKGGGKKGGAETPAEPPAAASGGPTPAEAIEPGDDDSGEDQADA